jgi:hypothetical protein
VQVEVAEDLRHRTNLLESFSRTSRWELTPSSLFAKRECRGLGVGNCGASLIVPPIVSGATPTLEAGWVAMLLAHGVRLLAPLARIALW